MELTVRALQESDWGTLQEWWTKWDWPKVTKEMLPLNGCSGLFQTKIIKGMIEKKHWKF